MYIYTYAYRAFDETGQFQREWKCTALPLRYALFL